MCLYHLAVDYLRRGAHMSTGEYAWLVEEIITSTERLEAAIEVRRAAWESLRRGSHFDIVMAGLQRVFPYDEALLSRWDPRAKEHVHVAGAMSPLQGDFIRYELHRDPLFGLVKRTGQTQWLSGLTSEQRSSSPTVRSVVEPLGYEEGLTQCLYSSEGRYVGVLNLGVRRPVPGLADAKRVLALLFDSLAAAVEAGPAVEAHASREWVSIVPDRQSADGPSLHGRDFPIIEVVGNAVRTRRLPATLMVPFQGMCVELRLQRVEDGTRAHCQVVEFDGPLSWREAEVLAEVARGRTNDEISAKLRIAPRTVATHLEHILSKLDAPNRAAAAAYGAALGYDLAPSSVGPAR